MEYIRITHPGPSLCVSAIVLRLLDENGPEVLLIHRGGSRGFLGWALPTCRLKRGETVQAAAARTVWQSVGHEVDILGLVDVLDVIRTDQAESIPMHHNTVIHFAARFIGNAEFLTERGEDIRWTPVDQVEDLLPGAKTQRIILESLRYLD